MICTPFEYGMYFWVQNSKLIFIFKEEITWNCLCQRVLRLFGKGIQVAKETELPRKGLDAMRQWYIMSLRHHWTKNFSIPALFMPRLLAITAFPGFVYVFNNSSKETSSYRLVYAI
jgi:hypothetical protein